MWWKESTPLCERIPSSCGPPLTTCDVTWPSAHAGIPAGDLLRKNRMPAQRELYTPAVDSRRILRESLAPTRQRALSETHSAYPTGGRPTLPAVKANLSTFRGDLTVRRRVVSQLLL